MNVLDLFSGIGGFSLGLERAGMKTAAFCEMDPFCQEVLAKHWPDIPIFDDVRGLDGKQFKGTVELICGGYPCQPFSLAGRRTGAKDDRHVWPEMFRLIQEIRPAWVLAENVAGHISLGLDSVLSDLENEGYTTETFLIPACAVDAKHQRNRLWIVAHASGERRQQKPQSPYGHESQNEGRSAQEMHKPSSDGKGHRNGILANASRRRCSRKEERKIQQSRRTKAFGPGETISDAPNAGLESLREWTKSPPNWPVESGVCRVADGVPRRVDRLRSLGNAVVPPLVEVIGRAIIESHYYGESTDD